MGVLVQGLSSVPSTCVDLSVQLFPDRPTSVSWEVASKLVDRRLARVVGYDNMSDFATTIDGRPAVYWLSPFSQGDGYGTAAESMVHWLAQHGVHLDVHHSWFLVEDGLREDVIAMLRSRTGIRPRIGVCMATPGEFEKLPTPYKIGFTMYEATNPLRVYPEWKHQCNYVDRLFVPSKFCADVFSTFTRRPIDVVPLAINEAYCRPVQRTAGDMFRVVTFATMTGRKAPLEMIEVFRKAFPDNKDVEFVIKTRLDLVGSQTPGLPAINDSRVKVISDTWYVDRVVKFLYDADCMMFLSKGEGFGMTPREAMATGCPTILANNTGMSEVCNSTYNWPVPTAHTEPSPLGGEWFIPDWDVAVDMLRDIYKNRKRAYAKGLSGGHWFIKHFGPSKAAGHMVDMLNRAGAVPVKRVPFSILPTRQQVGDILAAAQCKQYAIVTGFIMNDVNNKLVILTGGLASATHEQLRFLVQHALQLGACAVALVFPSVYVESTVDTSSKFWRIEELQHLLAGIGIAQLRYVDDRRVALAIVSRGGQIMPAFGHVIDRRWKPT